MQKLAWVVKCNPKGHRYLSTTASLQRCVTINKNRHWRLRVTFRWTLFSKQISKITQLNITARYIGTLNNRWSRHYCLCAIDFLVGYFFFTMDLNMRVILGADISFGLQNMFFCWTLNLVVSNRNLTNIWNWSRYLQYMHLHSFHLQHT